MNIVFLVFLAKNLGHAETAWSRNATAVLPQATS
jgi:hypothetical protein